MGWEVLTGMQDVFISWQQPTTVFPWPGTRGPILLRRQASKGLTLLASKSEVIHAHVASKAYDFLHKGFYIIKSLTPSVMHASRSKLPAWEGDPHY